MPKVDHKLSHKFQWVVPFDVTAEEAAELGLIKGVAMQSGKLKSGEIMTVENVYSGGGGMRAAMVMDKAKVNIDHMTEDLPDIYREKFGKEIGKDHIRGDIVDCQTVTEDTKAKVEFIAKVDKVIYDLIKAGKVKGNSVEDAVRQLNCTKNECVYEGSAYFNNALIMLEVPNSDGTWVDIVDEADLGTILVKDEEQIKKHSNNRIATYLKKHLKKHEMSEEDLNDYMTEGKWNDGVESVKKFLKEKKGIEDDEFAEFIFEHPTEFSQYQLTWNPGSDLMSWWERFKKVDNLEKRVMLLECNAKVVNNVPLIKEHAISLAEQKNEVKKTKHAVQWGMTEVNYMEEAEDPTESCMHCRHFSIENLEDPTGAGMCQIVSGNPQGKGGCAKWEINPTQKVEPKEGEEEGEEQPEEEQPMAKGKEQSEPVPKFKKSEKPKITMNDTESQKKSEYDLEIEKYDKIINETPVEGPMQAKAQFENKRKARVAKYNLVRKHRYQKTKK